MIAARALIVAVATVALVGQITKAAAAIKGVR